MSGFKSKRATRKAIRRRAAGLTAKYAAGGLVKIETTASLAALKAAMKRPFEGGREPVAMLIDHTAALGFPSSATRPAGMERCYRHLALDSEGRIAWTTTSAMGNAPANAELALVVQHDGPRVAAWRETPGFGDLKTRERA